MKAISELTCAEAAALQGVCFDVDDTITTEGVLDPDAYAALHALRGAGLTLVAATGRPLGWAELFARMWPVDAAVGENGAGWFFRDGHSLRTGWAEPESARAEQRERLARIAQRVREEMPHVMPTSDSWARRSDLAWDVGEHVRMPAADIAALGALIESEGARTVVSTVHAHAAFGEVDKATGIRAALREARGIDIADAPEAWLFVGDSGNDAAAFTWFPLSAGVANVVDFLPRLPTPPRFVAERRSGQGFAEIARVVLRRRAGDSRD